MAANLSNTHLGEVVETAYSGVAVETDMSKNPVLVPFLTDCIQENTKDRLDLLETAFNTLLTALSSAATTAGTGPITGTALGIAVTAASANSSIRSTARTVQNALDKPYLDGYK